MSEAPDEITPPSPEDEAIANIFDGPDPDEGADDGDGENDTEAKRQSRDNSAVLIGKVASKAEQVATADPKIISTAAGLLRTGTGIAELTTAIMRAPKNVTAPVNDLSSLATTSGSESDRLVAAMMLGRERMKAVWKLLGNLGVSGFTGAIPAADVKAAQAIAKGVAKVDKTVLGTVEDVRALLRKA